MSSCALVRFLAAVCWYISHWLLCPNPGATQEITQHHGPHLQASLGLCRVARQSKREEWKVQKTAGVLGRVVLARLALSEIGLLAGCLGALFPPSEQASATCEWEFCSSERQTAVAMVFPEVFPIFLEWLDCGDRPGSVLRLHRLCLIWVPCATMPWAIDKSFGRHPS